MNSAATSTNSRERMIKVKSPEFVVEFSRQAHEQECALSATLSEQIRQALRFRVELQMMRTNDDTVYS